LVACAVAGGLIVSAFAQAPAHRSCVVPRLRGYTLAAARRALSAAHCRLGSVHRPARHHHGTLRVTKQSVRAGKRLANDARVNLWLGFPQQQRARSTGQTIYVANSENNSITEYAARADGNVSPTRTISGSNAGL
jgi:beta-lactam-binding protein with PASTA domain